MKRLTTKVENRYIIECPNLQDYMEGKHQLKKLLSTQDKGIQKLGELEDIEEELGIDLIKLFKAMKNGIYVKQGEKILKKEIKDIRYSKDLTVHYELNGKQYDKIGAIMILYSDYNSQYCDFTNVYTYGKTWALGKNELTME